MSSSAKISVGQKLKKIFNRGKNKNAWAETSASVNTILFNNSYREDGGFQEPKIIIKSSKYRDILNLIVSTLFIEDKNLKSLILLELQENKVVKQNSELMTLVQDPAYIKLFLVGLAEKRGFSFLASKINFRTIRNNSNHISTIIEVQKHDSGTEKRYIPETRRIGVGYRDKGNLPDDSSSSSNRFIDFRKEQLEIEDKRKLIEDTTHFIEGLLQ